LYTLCYYAFLFLLSECPTSTICRSEMYAQLRRQLLFTRSSLTLAIFTLIKASHITLVVGGLVFKERVHCTGWPKKK